MNKNNLSWNYTIYMIYKVSIQKQLEHLTTTKLAKLQ